MQKSQVWKKVPHILGLTKYLDKLSERSTFEAYGGTVSIQYNSYNIGWVFLTLDITYPIPRSGVMTTSLKSQQQRRYISSTYKKIN